MSVMRVRPEVQATVYDPASGGYVALLPGVEFDSADAIVKANEWAFQSDAVAKSTPRVRSVSVEQATAAPGEKRNR